MYDRPREKLGRLGAHALSDHELVALVLGSGSRHQDVLTLATALLAETGGVHGLVRLSAVDLVRVSGIGSARSAQVLAALELGRRSLTTRAAERVRLSTPQQLAT